MKGIFMDQMNVVFYCKRVKARVGFKSIGGCKFSLSLVNKAPSCDVIWVRSTHFDASNALYQVVWFVFYIWFQYSFTDLLYNLLNNIRVRSDNSYQLITKKLRAWNGSLTRIQRSNPIVLSVSVSLPRDFPLNMFLFWMWNWIIHISISSVIIIFLF